ncbi:hypothetical protein E2C01_018581 [Portunus trituberculatus]|uniref:Secreted protein n=1 Tax=Portunus trituberculatus TaxID=210409 RepID=A0A5B7DXF1_PORTR|nr:hypothetical protein [Portunus trituberculatus]
MLGVSTVSTQPALLLGTAMSQMLLALSLSSVQQPWWWCFRDYWQRHTMELISPTWWHETAKQKIPYMINHSHSCLRSLPGSGSAKASSWGSFSGSALTPHMAIHASATHTRIIDSRILRRKTIIKHIRQQNLELTSNYTSETERTLRGQNQIWGHKLKISKGAFGR